MTGRNLESAKDDLVGLLTLAANVREDLHPGRVPVSRGTLNDTCNLLQAQADRIKELEEKVEELENELGLHEEEG